MKHYTVLEQHVDGSWWHHGKTFDTWGEAHDFMRKWIWWDEKRNKQIVGHDDPLPDETLYTYDFIHFYHVGGPVACEVKCDQL
jgi:hypothetical protein